MFIETTTHFDQYFYDGSIGLAYSSKNRDEITPIIHNMITQNHMQKPIISLYYNITEAEIIFGGSNPAYCQPSAKFEYINVSDHGQWAFHVKTIEVGTGVVLCAEGCKAQFDTTARVIIGPAYDVFQINSVLDEVDTVYEMSVVDCALVPEMPIINFNLDGMTLALTPADYIWQGDQSGEALCVSLFKAHDIRHFVQPTGWHFGASVLQKYCTELDIENHRIGLMAAKH